MKTLEGLRWHTRYNEHMGCIKGCLDYLGIGVSFPWLYGGTGNAFVLNMNDTVFVDCAQAWDISMLFDLAPNLGFTVEQFKVEHQVALEMPDDEFRRKQREAFDFCQARIDRGLPSYAWELTHIPAYYVITGYDNGHAVDAGYTYSGWDSSERGTCPWDKLGTFDVKLFAVNCVHPAEPATDSETIKAALTTVLNRIERADGWSNGPRYRTGLPAYDMWADALQTGRAIAVGAAYVNQVWLECREMAVEFLQEAQARLPGQCDAAFDESIARYGVVREKLRALSELHPERPEGWDWTKHVPQAPLEWLLEPENPSVRALALTELLDRDTDDDGVAEARQGIASAPYTAQILADQHPDGYWGKPERYFLKHTGTAWRWLLLHELGFDPLHPQMKKAAAFLLDVAFNKAQGGFGSQPGLNPVPCYNGWLLWGLYRSGYGDDPRVHSALRWVVDTMRYDDGDEQVPDPDNGCWGRHVCVRGVIPILRALGELPETYRNKETERVLQASVEFMLRHRVYKRSHNPDKPMNSKLTQLTFPGFYWPDFVEVLLLLTGRGCTDPRMEDAIAYLQRKQSKQGTWKLQRTYNERSKRDTFPVAVPLDERGAPSKWVTLRALIVLKRWFG